MVAPEVVPRGKRKEVNRSDLVWFHLFYSVWDGMGGNRFAVNISNESVELRVDGWQVQVGEKWLACVRNV